jgi:DNA-binding MarR family transcriptional regulator
MVEPKSGRLRAEVRVDAVLQLQLIGRLLADETMQKLRQSGFEDLRESDGYVFQHLVPGPIAITKLATLLGVTQQAASKSVAELEARGYVVRASAPDDARYRLVELSERGMSVIKTTRAVRATLEKQLLKGVADAGGFVTALNEIAESLGVSEVLRGRRVALPR